MEKVWRRVERLVREERGPREGLELLARSMELSLDRRERIGALPFEADRERLPHWLLELLEREPVPLELEGLRLRIAYAEWRGRVDGADLELVALQRTSWRASSPAGSAVLAKLARIVPPGAGEEPGLGEALVLLYAALAAQEMFTRLDVELLLGSRDSRSFEVGADAGPRLALGELTRRGWDRDAFGLRSGPLER